MKCAACGYEKENAKDPPFREVEATAWGDLCLISDYDYDRTIRPRNVVLRACPDCGTVRIEQ